MPNMNDRVLLSAEKLAKNFGNREIFSDVELEVRSGECVGIIGPNGAGKSTLLGILAGEIQPDDGQITHGESVLAKGREAQTGLIAQRFNVNPGLTVAQAIFRGTNIGPSEERQRARALLAQAGISLDPMSRVGGLTRPDVGLVESMRLWADDTVDVVLVDEVSARFNTRELDELHWIVNKITSQGRSVVYVSHRLDEVRALCDRVLLLREGTLVETDPDADLEGEIHAGPIAHSVPKSHVRDQVALEVVGLSSGVVSDVSFTVAAGEIVGFVGGRDSGMQDVIAALTGKAPVESGTVTVQGRQASINTREGAVRAGIAHHWPGAGGDHVAANLVVGIEDDDDFDEAQTATASILAAMEQMDNHGLKLFGERQGSFGQTESRYLSALLSANAAVLVLEDPSATLDAAARAALHEHLTAATERGMAVVLISSDSRELVSWTRRLFVFREGRLSETWNSETVTTVRLDKVFREGAATSVEEPDISAESEPGPAQEPTEDKELNIVVTDFGRNWLAGR